MLSFLNIKEELFAISPLTFSGGEQQRVNIAKGIIAPKSVLLLDEPTASLDMTNTNKVIDKLLEIKKQGVTMIGIFHDMDCMKRISDKIYDMKEKDMQTIIRSTNILINGEFTSADIVIQGIL
ncbi:ATP-binding cassette domain-containing protein [Halarcobacter anaerophilus]|uniref:ATP-binding cassette domain-containing protein n=1 Tax=Halarcobacter anaerophilus TaxID=877500 RepID=UPI000A9FBF26|nr:ATP-binding cassette domain-containing protein [Halarcobacter anaerophilus]